MPTSPSPRPAGPRPPSGRPPAYTPARAPASLPPRTKLSAEAEARERLDHGTFGAEAVLLGQRTAEYPKLLDAPEWGHIQATYTTWGARLDALRALVGPRQRHYDQVRRQKVPDVLPSEFQATEAQAFFDLHGWEPLRVVQPAAPEVEPPEPPPASDEVPDWMADIAELMDGPTPDTAVTTPGPAPAAPAPLTVPGAGLNVTAAPSTGTDAYLVVLTRIAVALEQMAAARKAVALGKPTCPVHGPMPAGQRPGQWDCSRCRWSFNRRDGLHERVRA